MKAKWALLAVAFTAGCGPKVIAFDITPRFVCAGDTVRVSWKVRGEPQLLVSRRRTDSSDVMRYTLIVRSRGKSAYSDIDVLTFSPDAPVVLVAETSMLGSDSLMARDSAPAEAWNSLVRVGTVMADSGRALRVRHGGVEGVLEAGGAPSGLWRGLAVGGPWEILTKLQDGEVPGDPNRHPPLHLSIGVSLTCTQAGERQ